MTELSTVRLRTATADDATLLATLGARLFEQTFGPANTAADMAAYLAEAFSPERQAAELAEADRVTWIAEQMGDGAPVGYAVLIRDARVDCVPARRAAELRRIYVDLVGGARSGPASPGLGALLMERCLDQARAWGCDVLWLAVWEENARAIRFYEKHGFRKMGVKDFQLGADVQHDFIMARNL